MTVSPLAFITMYARLRGAFGFARNWPNAISLRNNLIVSFISSHLFRYQ
jgi:hypothetical protein